MTGADLAFGLVGLFMLGCAWDQWPRSRGSALFWLLLGLLFGLGGHLPARLNGVLLLTMVLLDAAGWIRPGERAEPVPQTAPGVAWPVLTIALVLMLTGLVGSRLGLDATQSAIYGLALGSVAGAGMALLVTRDSPLQLLRSGSALNQTIGSVSILPQLLASLGVVLAAAQLGPKLAGWLSPLAGTSLFGAVVMTCLAMSGLSALTGNSFAAYPVAAGGILVPILLHKTGADPSALAVWTLTVGACGTLVTPMAANFNLVPAALLDLPDRYGVLKKQWPFGVAMWTGHVLWMWVFVSL